MNSHRRFRRATWSAAIVLALSFMTVGHVLAQSKRGAAPAPAPAPSAPAGAPNITSTSTAKVEGFRSAKFGMDEAAVKAAIAKDFNVKGADVKEQPNAGERTKVLLVKAPDVLPGGGAAEISYVFGYQSKKLIQVSVAWSKAIDDKMTPEQLFSSSSVLRAHFMGEGFKPDTVASNMPINGGLLIFRGSDDNDRTAMLILQGTLTQGENNQRILTPTSLLLFYVADAKAPDVYRLPSGSF
jgi:hypothetical protein